MTPVRPENCTDAEWQEIRASADHANQADIQLRPNGVWVKVDDNTGYLFTREGLIGLQKELNELRDKNDDLRYEANHRNPSRFLPEVIKKLEAAACAAIDKGDDGRAEAYSMAVMLIRVNLKKE